MTAEEFYGKNYPQMKQAEKKLLDLMDNYRVQVEENYDLQPIIYTCSRIKKPKRMLEKLERKGFERTLDAALTKVNDAIGIRAVCAFAEDVYRLVNWLYTRSEIVILEKKDYYANPKPNGYRSYHIIVRVEVETGKTFLAEFQIRTIRCV